MDDSCIESTHPENRVGFESHVFRLGDINQRSRLLVHASCLNTKPLWTDEEVVLDRYVAGRTDEKIDSIQVFEAIAVQHDMLVPAAMDRLFSNGRNKHRAQLPGCIRNLPYGVIANRNIAAVVAFVPPEFGRDNDAAHRTSLDKVPLDKAVIGFEEHPAGAMIPNRILAQYVSAAGRRRIADQIIEVCGQQPIEHDLEIRSARVIRYSGSLALFRIVESLQWLDGPHECFARGLPPRIEQTQRIAGPEVAVINHELVSFGA